MLRVFPEQYQCLGCGLWLHPWELIHVLVDQGQGFELETEHQGPLSKGCFPVRGVITHRHFYNEGDL